MPVRYIGAVFVFVSCGAFGFLLAANYRREERCLAELLRLLESMQNEMEYRLTPLPAICESIAQEATGCLKRLFAALSQELEHQISPDVTACMQAALHSVHDMPSAVKKALLDLGNSFGKYDLQGQINELIAVKQQCRATLGAMRTNMEMRLRSYQTLGLCAGAGLAILFL